MKHWLQMPFSMYLDICREIEECVSLGVMLIRDIVLAR